MATAPESPAQILAAIEELYRQLSALPAGDRPDASGSRRQTSTACAALEAQIRMLAERYAAVQKQKR
jgi:hypothetical protein